MNTNSSALIVPPPASTASVATTNDIRDIKAPVEIPNEWAWVWWSLTAVLLLTAALAAWFWWRKKKLTLPPLPSVPPHIRAKNRLSGAFTLLHDPKAFCSLVSDTLRVYLEERFQFRAPERTTEEFLLELRETAILNPEQKQRLAEFLERCDLVKFARFEPTETELRELLDAAVRLIDETRFEVALPQTPLTPSISPPPAPVPPPLPPIPEPQPAETNATRPPS
jgi:hypothetical protein